MIKYLIFVQCFIFIFSFANDSSSDSDMKKISEAMGHMIGKNLQILGLPLDFDALVQGLKDASSGAQSPLSDEECIEAIAQLQETADSKICIKHLEEAIAFLEENKEKQGVVSLDDGKLQYCIVKPGTGRSLESYNRPLVRYKGKTLSGEEISQAEEFLDFDEVSVVFQKGLSGMKEGEVRTLFVHPDLGFGGKDLSSLTILEVEMVMADTSRNEDSSSIFPPEIDLQMR